MPARTDESADGEDHLVVCHLDELLIARGMTLVELAARSGITVANLSVLKNDRARAIRFTTLTAICRALDCEPGDLLSLRPRHQP
ncbi:putative transcriptional regulator [Sanguibacter gelidistatuariae]|uniref:Putative transcriptional regulator n=1 Tax=Sanguibacter gelidistatuariae TaxID=1814289 RepID=A0A1G6TH57_9MICO|nr:helix-turn-helix transcriptional regulator [Sanguibacter gelidistatuariae]SDD28410.1 putative transcriptional regulator [Sanguibacter gelidistatuariae]